jgi:hypothetical protein
MFSRQATRSSTTASTGTLRLIRPAADATPRRLSTSIVWRADEFLGPATTWMAERLAAATQAWPAALLAIGLL